MPPRRLRDAASPLMSFWALVLAACGGGGGGQPVTTGEPSSPEDRTKPSDDGAGQPAFLIAGRVANGPARNARVYLDINDDGHLDDGDLFVATTDSGGRFAARRPEFAPYRDKPLLVDLTNAVSPRHPFLAGGSTTLPDMLRAPPGSDVVTPLTELLVLIHGLRPTEAQTKAFSARLGMGDRLITETDPFAPSLMADTPQLAASLQAAARRVSEMIRANRDSRDERPDARPDIRPAGGKNADQMLQEAEQLAGQPQTPAITVSVIEDANRIHENFPTSKSVFTVSQSYELVDGFGDNHLFRLVDDGRLFFRNMPDFEAPADMDRNNSYRIRLIRREEDGDLSFINLSVTIADLIQEFYTAQPIGRNGDEDGVFIERNAKPTLDFGYEEIFGQGRQVSGPLTKYLLSGTAWRMPEQGPLVLTWSLVTDSNKRQTEALEIDRFPHKDVPNSFIKTQAQIDQARRYIEAVLAEFERAANIRFVEVDHSQYNRGDVPITYLFLPENYTHVDGTPGAWAGPPGALARHVQLFNSREDYTHSRGEPVHEIGHALGMRHPFHPHDQNQTVWPYKPRLETDFGTIMSYAPKGGWVGLTAADIAVLQFLYGAPQGAGAGAQRLEIEAFLGERANGRRPPSERVIDREEEFPDPPQFRGDAKVMTVPYQTYSFSADTEAATLSVSYFILETGNTATKFRTHGFPEPILTSPFHVDRKTGDIEFFSSHLLADRLLHKQQIVSVVLDPDRPALWSQSIKTIFAHWPSIDALSDALADPARSLLNSLGIVFGRDSAAERAAKHARARDIIDRLLKKREIDDDAPVSEKIADLSAYPNAKLIWKGTGSQYLQGVDPVVDEEIFPVLSDAKFFEIRADRGLYVRNEALYHQKPRDSNGDNKYDLFIEYGEAGAEKHVAFRITVTDEPFEDDESTMSELPMLMDVMSMDVM